MAGSSDKRPVPTPRYDAEMGRAAEIARAASSASLRAEHLFLAIIHDRSALPTQLLAKLVDLDQVEAAIFDATNAAAEPSGSEPPEWGFRAARAKESSYVGVEHAFLDLIRNRRGIPAQALMRVIDVGQVESAISDFLSCRKGRVLSNPEDPRIQFLPAGKVLDEPLIQAIRESVPQGSTFGINWDNGRPYIYVSGPRNSRDVVNAALARLGRGSV